VLFMRISGAGSMVDTQCMTQAGKVQEHEKRGQAADAHR
jgi:hypothetical protein